MSLADLRFLRLNLIQKTIGRPSAQELIAFIENLLDACEACDPPQDPSNLAKWIVDIMSECSDMNRELNAEIVRADDAEEERDALRRLIVRLTKELAT